jgi:MFS family permease
MNGIYAAGGAFGCVFNMWSSEYFGRKRSIQIGCCISLVGAIIMTASVAIPMFIVSRFVSMVPLYLSSMRAKFLDHGFRHRCPGNVGTALPE